MHTSTYILEIQMGRNKGQKAALMRQMGEDGAFGPKRPPRVGRKEPVTPTLELCIEIIELFERGEMLIDICESDPRFPTELAFRMFVSRDEALSARWANAQTPSADALMAHAWRRLNREVIGPDGRHDSGAVARDRAIGEFAHLLASARDPARWSRKSEHMVVGDQLRPIALREPLLPSEVAREMLRHLAEAERGSARRRPRCGTR
jgi:hypothetical protein